MSLGEETLVVKQNACSTNDEGKTVLLAVDFAFVEEEQVVLLLLGDHSGEVDQLVFGDVIAHHLTVHVAHIGAVLAGHAGEDFDS